MKDWKLILIVAIALIAFCVFSDDDFNEQVKAARLSQVQTPAEFDKKIDQLKFHVLSVKAEELTGFKGEK